MKKLLALFLALWLCCLSVSCTAEPSIRVTAADGNTLDLALSGLPAGRLITAVYRDNRMIAAAVQILAAGATAVTLTFQQELRENDTLKAFLLGEDSAAPLIDAAELELWKKEEDEMNTLTVTFNGHTYTATLAENPSVDAFLDYLKSQGGSVTVHAHDYGSFEKVGELGTTLVQSNTQIDTVPGDLILYQGSNVCLYYSTNSWNFTRLGKLEGDLSNLRSDLGSGNVDIVYSLS